MPASPLVAPTLREQLALAAAALGLRLVLWLFVFGVCGFEWERFLSLSDAGSYLNVARGIFLGDSTGINSYDARAFTGWPLLFGGLLYFTSSPWAMLGLTGLCAAAVPILYLRLSVDRVGAWLLVGVPPVWLLSSVHPMNEAWLLTLSLGALLAWRDRRDTLAGFLLGWAFVTRPYILALIVPVIAWSALDTKGLTRCARLALGALPCAIVAASINLALYGDLFMQVRTYAKPLVELNLDSTIVERLNHATGAWAPPFVALLSTPRAVPTPLWKLIYIYGHVAAILTLALWCVVRGWRFSLLTSLDRIMAAWFLCATAAALCGGPYWGFHCFDRYAIWSLPAIVWLARRALPLRWPVWVLPGALAGSSFLVALSLLAKR